MSEYDLCTILVNLYNRFLYIYNLILQFCMSLFGQINI